MTVATHGVTPGAKDGGGPGSNDGVGLHSPIAEPPRNGGGLRGRHRLRGFFLDRRFVGFLGLIEKRRRGFALEVAAGGGLRSLLPV